MTDCPVEQRCSDYVINLLIERELVATYFDNYLIVSCHFSSKNVKDLFVPAT